MEHLRNGIQQFLGECGEAACCALCLVDVAQQFMAEHSSRYGDKRIDVIDALYQGIDAGFIHYDAKNLNDNENMYVSYPARFLELLTGIPWEYRWGAANYKPKKNEYIFQRYERIKTGSVIGHFQRDGYFYPIIDSATATYGRLVSTRICKAIV